MASEEDLGLLKEFSSIYRQGQFVEWFAEGKFIFLALRQGTPVGFHVVSRRSRTRLPYSRFPLEDRQVWIVDVYTIPSERRRHVALGLRNFREKILAEMGYRESVSTVMAHNIPSLAYVTRGRYRRIAHLRFCRVFGFTSLTIVEDARDKLGQHLQRHGVPLAL